VRPLFTFDDLYANLIRKPYTWYYRRRQVADRVHHPKLDFSQFRANLLERYLALH
jgi:hypothetical protein